jgi:hypothetical protein
MASRSGGRGYDHLPEHRRRIYARDASHDFDELIERSFATGKAFGLSLWPDGTPVADEADAWRLLGKIANCRAGRRYTIRRNQGDGLGPRQRPDGRWEAWFAARPKARAGTT